MLEKLAAGMLGSAVSSVLGGLLGGTKKTDTANATGFEDILLGSKEKSEAENLGINESDNVSTGTQEALGMLREMTSGGISGYFKWMVKQIREKVMDDMGVTEADLKNMPADQRNALTQKIEEEVKKQVAKIMGVDPEAAAKMIQDGTGVEDAMARMESNKAYKNVPEIV